MDEPIQPPVLQSQKLPKSKFAVVSVILLVLAIFLTENAGRIAIMVAALGCGIIGLIRILKAKGKLGGVNFATTGIAFSIVFILFDYRHILVQVEQDCVAAVRAPIKSKINEIKYALDAFEVDNGFYPKSIQDLVTAPSNAKNWHGPYLEKVPQDPWGNNYLYYFPGKHNTGSYDLLSVGPDGKEGTDDDVGNWSK